MKRNIGYVAALVCAVVIMSLPILAAGDNVGDRFTDVPNNHWAATDIEALAAGGLVNGMGDGTFAPDAQLTIAQMATIIANAKGVETGEAGGKWYGKAVQAALDAGYLPSQSSSVTGGAYEQPCPRELAVVMVIRGLGIQPGSKANGKGVTDIPDYGLITRDYRQDVLKAVQYGIINGIDDKGTFGPQQALTRAQICAILNRAGYRTAAPKAAIVTDGQDNAALFEVIKATGLFKESAGKDPYGNPTKVLTATARKHAGLKVVLYHNNTMDITAKEYDRAYVFDEKSNIVDEDGNIFAGAATQTFEFYDANGKFVCPSGFSYNSRQLLQQIFSIVFPGEEAAAVDAMKAILLEPYAYTGLSDYPNAVRWLNGRAVIFGMGNNGYVIELKAANDKDLYDRYMSHAITSNPKKYHMACPGDGNFIDFATAYELTRW